MSNLIDIETFHPVVFCLRKWRISLVIRILSVIKCIGTKVLWILEIIWDRTFEIVLYKTLQRLMSLKSLTVLGHFFFKIRVIKVLFSSMRKVLVCRACRTSLVTSCLILELLVEQRGHIVGSWGLRSVRLTHKNIYFLPCVCVVELGIHLPWNFPLHCLQWSKIHWLFHRCEHLREIS